MDILVHVANGYTYLRIIGDISGADAGVFQNLIEERLQDGSRTFIVNLQEVVSIDGEGISMFLGTQRAIECLNGHLVLCEAERFQLSSKTATALHFFEVHDTEEDACAAVGAPLPEFGSATS